MSTGLRLDTSAFTSALQALASRDVGIAVAWALNDTATDVLDHIQDRMKVVFDRPTRFTQNAFMVVKAQANRAEAAVQERPLVGSRHYLKVEESGGPRAQSGFERLLSRSLAYEGIVQSIIPADNARLDAYGNWSAGERNQVLSGLMAQRDGLSNSTAASKKRNAKRAAYFIPKHGLSPDIYKREASGQIGVIAHISAKVPVYQQRLGFFDTAADVWRDKLPGHLARTIGQMIAKRFGTVG
ncbi:hypothetical protein [Cypionkella sp.]|uniref:hypothetical protein n=1 Tax=Cypionkella sp. TaxID=2811411 RepID=UPI0027201CA6|nr:hypothetical protein [Cypionkella sp.]MDO8982755.1 hypothetical protein [Cypionkella sp.]